MPLRLRLRHRARRGGVGQLMIINLEAITAHSAVHSSKMAIMNWNIDT